MAQRQHVRRVDSVMTAVVRSEKYTSVAHKREIGLVRFRVQCQELVLLVTVYAS